MTLVQLVPGLRTRLIHVLALVATLGVTAPGQGQLGQSQAGQSHVGREGQARWLAR